MFDRALDTRLVVLVVAVAGAFADRLLLHLRSDRMRFLLAAARSWRIVDLI